jgi:predicted dehydrogenase
LSINEGSRPVRAGVYGAGAFGNYVVQALAPSLDVRVIAAASRTPSRAAELAQRQGVPRAHASFEEMLADPDIDLLILATPPAEHGPQSLAALTAGKHVFVEKPQATSLDEAERVIALAAACKLVVGVDYPMLYTPLVEAVAIFNKSRLVGPLLRVSVENIASCAGLDDSHWFWARDLSGGIFVEHGVHFFDWCGRLAGEAQHVTAFAATRGIREDRVFAAVEHAGGAMASYYHAFVAKPDTERTRAVLSFESVDIVLDGWIPTRMHMAGPSAAVATTTIRRMLRRSVESVPDARVGFFFDAGKKSSVYTEGVRAAIEDLARAVREPGHVALCDARRALPSLRVGLAARDAARNGVTVDLTLTPSATPP